MPALIWEGIQAIRRDFLPNPFWKALWPASNASAGTSNMYLNVAINVGRYDKHILSHIRRIDGIEHLVLVAVHLLHGW